MLDFIKHGLCNHQIGRGVRITTVARPLPLSYAAVSWCGSLENNERKRARMLACAFDLVQHAPWFGSTIN